MKFLSGLIVAFSPLVSIAYPYQELVGNYDLRSAEIVDAKASPYGNYPADHFCPKTISFVVYQGGTARVQDGTLEANQGKPSYVRGLGDLEIAYAHYRWHFLAGQDRVTEFKHYRTRRSVFGGGDSSDWLVRGEWVKFETTFVDAKHIRQTFSQTPFAAGFIKTGRPFLIVSEVGQDKPDTLTLKRRINGRLVRQCEYRK